MKNPLLRFLGVIPAIPMLFNGVGFLTKPEQTAETLGMDLLDGIGRSTQIGDTASFFIGTAILILIGVMTTKARWFYAGAMFLGLAAVSRTIAALAFGAEMATQFIAVEIVLTLWLCAVAYFIDRLPR
jgi:low temperature requirement protein LtrA